MTMTARSKILLSIVITLLVLQYFISRTGF